MGDNLNKLGRGPLGDATYQYQGSRPYGFRQDFFMLSLYKPMLCLCLTCDPTGHNLNKLGRGLLGLLGDAT